MSLIRVGRIEQPHGVGGRVKVVSEASRFDALVDRRYWLIGFDPESVLHVRVEDSVARTARGGPVLIAKLSCCASRSHAERLTGAAVYLPSSDVGSGRTDADVWIGFRAIDSAGRQLGVVRDYRPMPGQDLFVLEMPNGKEALIPNTPAIVTDVDDDARTITVNVIEGLLDL
ncbi:MAG: ribosome maturation factor RimM [Rhodothermales bacterium]|nr:ribosome maturation factor RimM [Rhodothermales bacterium]